MLLALTAPAQTEKWQIFHPPDKSFSIALPGQPAQRKETLKTAAGKVEVMVYVVEPKNANPAWFVSHSEPVKPPTRLEPEEKRLDRARDSAVAALRGKVKAERRLTLQTHPGRELEIEVEQNRQARLRIYAVRYRLFTLLVVGTPEQLRSQQMEQFFASFKVPE